MLLRLNFAFINVAFFFKKVYSDVILKTCFCRDLHFNGLTGGILY